MRREFIIAGMALIIVGAAISEKQEAQSMPARSVAVASIAAAEEHETVRDARIYAMPLERRERGRPYRICPVSGYIALRNTRDVGAVTRIKVPIGTKVSLSETLDGGWIYVVAGGQGGFVSKQDVLIPAPPAEPLPVVPDPPPIPTPTPRPEPIPVPTPEPSPSTEESSGDIVVQEMSIPDPDVLSQVTLFYNGANLNMRTGPSTSYPILLNIPAGTHLLPNATAGGWYRVTYDGNEGWVSGGILGKGEVWMVQGVIIANKGHNMSSTFNPGEHPAARSAVNQMISAANRAGLTLNAFSGFRTYSRQQTLYSNYVANHGQTKADTFSARPGHSEHQTGLAFDVGGKDRNLWLSERLAETPEGRWMAENAHRFGFVLSYPKGKEHITGYQYEPWHFRYVGNYLAGKIRDSGKTLDEYLGTVAPNYR